MAGDGEAVKERQKAEGTKARTYRDLIVWQKAMEMAKQIYQMAKFFLKDEKS